MQTVCAGFGHHSLGAAIIFSERALIRSWSEDPFSFPAAAITLRNGIATKLSSLGLRRDFRAPAFTISRMGTVRRNRFAATGNTLTTSRMLNPARFQNSQQPSEPAFARFPNFMRYAASGSEMLLSHRQTDIGETLKRAPSSVRFIPNDFRSLMILAANDGEIPNPPSRVRASGCAEARGSIKPGWIGAYKDNSTITRSCP